MEFEPMLTPREKSPLPENVPRVSNPRHFGSEPKHYQLSYSGPRLVCLLLLLLLVCLFVVYLFVVGLFFCFFWVFFFFFWGGGGI